MPADIGATSEVSVGDDSEGLLSQRDERISAEREGEEDGEVWWASSSKQLKRDESRGRGLGGL